MNTANLGILLCSHVYVCMYVFICLFAYYIGSMQFQMQLWKTSSNQSCAHAQQMLAHWDPGLSLALKPSNPYMSN